MYKSSDYIIRRVIPVTGLYSELPVNDSGEIIDHLAVYQVAKFDDHACPEIVYEVDCSPAWSCTCPMGWGCKHVRMVKEWILEGMHLPDFLYDLIDLQQLIMEDSNG